MANRRDFLKQMVLGGTTLLLPPVLARECALNSNSQYSQTIGPWDVTELKEVPEWRETDLAPKDGMTSLLYQSIDYLGDTVEVFGYYSVPEGPMPEGGWPAAVFVHGGGGTAFPIWVEYWNNHGYACISIDVEGHIPVKDADGRRLSTPHPGPSRVGVWDDYTKPIEEQWFYHAVAQVLKAHSLIASFPEVNADKIGLLGPSWGGTITSTAMGIDDRLAWAIPIYGAGFLSESDGHQGTVMSPPAQAEFVDTHYDGSLYFNNVTFPTLWVNGTNDKHFAMTCNQKSAQATNGLSIMRFKKGYRHGNIYARNTEEIYAFADQVVKDADPLPEIGKPEMISNTVLGNVQSSVGLKSARLMYTKDDGQWNQRIWKEGQASISGNTIQATIPDNTTVFFFSVTDSRGYMVSSEYLETSDTL